MKAVPILCDNRTRKVKRPPGASLRLPQPPCLHSCNFTRRTCDCTQLQPAHNGVSAAYAALSTKRPYAVAFGSCAVKGVIADTISQRIVEGKQEQNWKRTAVFAFYGGWYCGWFQHALYNVGYARLFGLDTSLKNA